MAQTLLQPRFEPHVKRPGSDSTPPAPATAAASKRERLRNFQTSLSERVKRAQHAPVTSNRLGLQIGATRLLVELVEAGEIIVIPNLTPVPLVQPWYRGIANVRGSLLGIVDLSLFAGGPPTPLDHDSRILTFGHDLRFGGGILISRMLGLRNTVDLEAVTGAVGAAGAVGGVSIFAPWTRSRFTDAEGTSWEALDLAALISDDRYLRIGRF